MNRRNPSRKGPLVRPTVQFDDPTLTRFAGLLPLIRYLENELKLPTRLREACETRGRRRLFPIHQVLFAFLVATLAGVAKLAHLDLLRNDRVLAKMSRLARWPVRKVFSLALSGTSDADVSGITSLIRELGCGTFANDESYVLDFDTSALIAYGEQEGAAFGFCGWGRNRRRYYPIVAAVGSTRAAVNARFRDGSAMKAEEEAGFLLETIDDVAKRAVGKLAAIRADAGFWSNHMMTTLLARNIPFAISHPLNAAVKLQLRKLSFAPLDGDEDVELAVVEGKQLGYPDDVHVVVIRRRVHDPKAPPQGKKVDFDPMWRYQAIATSLPSSWDAYDVWNFYNHRACVELVFRSGKQELGLDWLVSHSFRGNQTAFLMRLLAMNADLSFHAACVAKASAEGRKLLRTGLGFRQTRLYNLAGRLVDHGGNWVLRLAPNRMVRALFTFYAQDLPVAA